MGSGEYLSVLGRSEAGGLTLELGLANRNSGSSWFRIRPASQNKTDGEKVSVRMYGLMRIIHVRVCLRGCHVLSAI